MGEFIYFYKLLKPTINFLWAIMIMLFTLVSCKSIDVKNKPDLFPYMLKPAALLSTKPPGIIESVWPDIIYNFEQNLRRIPGFGKITGTKEINNKLTSNPKLLKAYKTYINTITLTGISDKEIALRLEDEFESPHFLLLDLVSFPCTNECKSDEQWVIRLRMIEASTGEIIFRVRLKHQLDADEQNFESYKELVDNMISDVMTEFKTGFIVPWHRWRYEHMKKESEISLRSEMGI